MLKVFTLTIMTAMMPVVAFAQTEPNFGPICAAVQPCDTEYNLLDEYADPEGACFDVYVSRCLQEKVTATSNELRLCEFSKKDLESQLVDELDLKFKLKKIRRKFRKLRRSSK